LAGDWQQLRELRLRALSSDPLAFSSSFAETSTYPDSLWRQRAEESEAGSEYRWFVGISDDGTWAGMAQAQAGEQEARLNGMWTAPQARGSGLARALCDACADWAREHGFAGIRLGAYGENPRAIALYEKAGFEQFEVRPIDDGLHTEVVLMRRGL
jgi:ribosomal protein S18 acetylase RimI-like enzyme